MGFGALFIGLFFMLIGWMVSSRLKSKFKQYSETHLSKDLTGAEVARLMLADNGIRDVQVTCVDGQLTDHYDPSTKTVNLSQEVFYGRNAAATAVASHECGHAVQHANAYSMLQFRSAMVPVQNISASVLNFIFMASIFGGFFAHSFLPWNTAILIMIACYGVFALFAVVTLPVEFDASRRALAWVKTRNIVTPAEYDMAQDALKWAAMTYLVAAIGAIVTLAYYVMQYLGSRD
jgi:Zn-dependent membrane protease YugP